MTIQLRWIPTLLLVCAVTALGSQSAAAQGRLPTMTKEELLNRWAAALGGRKVLENARTIHTRGTVESGDLKGTFETWTISSGAVRLAVKMSRAHHQVVVFDGHDGWVLDSSDTVQKLSGAALSSLVTRAYQGCDSFLFSNRMHGRVSLAGNDPVRGAYVLILMPEGGTPVTLYLDKKTFLPSGEKQAGPKGERTISYSDWRDFGGMMFPGTVRQSTGDARFDETVRTEEVEINGQVAKGVFEKPAESATTIHFNGGVHQVVIPVQVFGGAVFVPVHVNNSETGWFLLDSAATMSIISKQFAEKAGVVSEGAMEAQGGANSTTAAYAKNVMLNLPGAYMPAKSVAVLDLSGSLPMVGRPFDGYLGSDFFGHLVVRVDYEQKQITLSDPATFVMPKNAPSLPVTFTASLPIVSGKILLAGRAPIETKCVIDSGSGGMILAAPFVKANHVIESVPKRISISVSSAGGAAAESEGRIDGLQFGTVVLRKPVTTFSGDTKGMLASNEFGAFVGGEILDRFTVTFDYPHQRILLEASHNLHDPFRANESGVSLIATGKNFERFEVDIVEPGSPGAAAGLLKGDILTQIDGVFEQTGRTIQLIVKRGDRILTLKIKLEERI
jgi:Aspartyl protease